MKTRPVRVLYDIHPHIVGGTERFLARLLERFDRSRYEPMVVSSQRGRPLHLIEALGIQTVVVKGLQTQAALPRLADFMRRARIGLVQSNYYAPGLAIAAGLANIPHIWRPGGHVEVVSAERNRTGRQRLTSADVRVILNTMTMLSTVILCNSQYVKSQFGRGRLNRIAVIPNGVPAPPRITRRREKGSVRVGMVAHFSPQKRHQDFIRAATLVAETRDDVSFVIFGGSYAHARSRTYEDAIRRAADRAVGRRNIEIRLFTSDAADAVRSCDLIVLPSVGESCSNAVLEAMAAGVPVIAARSGGNPELITHGKTGLLVAPERPELLGRMILSLLGDPRRMHRIGMAGRVAAQTRFSMDTCVSRYQAAYAQVASSPVTSIHR